MSFFLNILNQNYLRFSYYIKCSIKNYLTCKYILFFLELCKVQYIQHKINTLSWLKNNVVRHELLENVAICTKLTS